MCVLYLLFLYNTHPLGVEKEGLRGFLCQILSYRVRKLSNGCCSQKFSVKRKQMIKYVECNTKNIQYRIKRNVKRKPTKLGGLRVERRKAKLELKIIRAETENNQQRIRSILTRNFRKQSTGDGKLLSVITCLLIIVYYNQCC